MNQPHKRTASLLQVMMVTEYMQGGDLGLALAKDTPSNRRLSWYNSGSHIALCIARGLAYLHAQKASPHLSFAADICERHHCSFTLLGSIGYEGEEL